MYIKHNAYIRVFYGTHAPHVPPSTIIHFTYYYDYYYYCLRSERRVWRLFINCALENIIQEPLRVQYRPAHLRNAKRMAPLRRGTLLLIWSGDAVVPCRCFGSKTARSSCTRGYSVGNVIHMCTQYWLWCSHDTKRVYWRCVALSE